MQNAKIQSKGQKFVPMESESCHFDFYLLILGEICLSFQISPLKIRGVRPARRTPARQGLTGGNSLAGGGVMKGRALSQPPNLDEEGKLKSQGYELIAGIDEVGRGALAGPVVASAVILPHPANLPWLGLVRDSKELNSRQRESLFDLINKEAV